MKKLLALALTLTFFMSMTLSAAYAFESGGSTVNDFGTSTSTDRNVIPDPLSENVRRNKDAAYMPPPYGVFSGDIPTDESSPYHDSYRQSGPIAVNQELPPGGGEDYSPGIDTVTWETSTSLTQALDTVPWYYADGSMGTLKVGSKTIKVYEGETTASMDKGAGHFAATSAWDGNVALIGHNRGANAYFSFIKDMKIGDTVTYTTRYGTRTYAVYSKTQIGEYDYTKLGWSNDNILTLITCVADTPELRWAVQLKEVQ